MNPFIISLFGFVVEYNTVVVLSPYSSKPNGPIRNLSRPRMIARLRVNLSSGPQLTHFVIDAGLRLLLSASRELLAHSVVYKSKLGWHMSA
jgi:hypothetical protein